jgi:hypothetical protein
MGYGCLWHMANYWTNVVAEYTYVFFVKKALLVKTGTTSLLNLVIDVAARPISVHI